jgi:uncharacterized membrane protein YbaN (DUF454 family)
VNIRMSSFRKIIFYCAGFLFLGIGIAGYILPGLPGTVFLILSASCFLRSNENMYKWVTRHRMFGSLVRDYMETGSMPKRAKFIAVSSIWIFSVVSVLFAPYRWFFDVIVLSLAIIGTVYILSRPTSAKL